MWAVLLLPLCWALEVWSVDLHMSRDKGISEVNCVGRRGLNTGLGKGLGKPLGLRRRWLEASRPTPDVTTGDVGTQLLYKTKEKKQVDSMWFRQGPSDVRILNHLFLLIYILGDGAEAVFAFCAWCFLEVVMLKESGVIWSDRDNCKEGLHREPNSTTQLPLFRFPCGKNASIYNLIKMPPRTNNALPIFSASLKNSPSGKRLWN